MQIVEPKESGAYPEISNNGINKYVFSFKIRTVTINRPWMDLNFLKNEKIGIRGLEDGAWSTGELDDEKNNGSFPLLPTHFVVAKDIEIKEQKDAEIEESMKLRNVFSMEDKANRSTVCAFNVLHSIIYCMIPTYKPWGEVTNYWNVMPFKCSALHV